MYPSAFITASLLNNPTTLFGAGLCLLILFLWYFATDSETRKRNVGSVLVVGMCALCAYACWPPDKAFKGGIDLVGGSSFTLVVEPKIDDEGHQMPLTEADIGQAVKTVERRLNEYGTVDMLINKLGANKIQIQMPGMSTEESAVVEELLKKVAKLELHEVHPQSSEPGPDGRTLAQRVLAGDEIVPGYKAYTEARKVEGKDISETILLNKRVALGGKDIQNASATSNGSQQAVSVVLNGAGAAKMLKLTEGMRLNVDRIAVLLDDKVLTAPTVNAVLSKQFEITGNFTHAEATDLSNSLMNPLENPLKIDNKVVISPTLGKAVIQQGVWAGLVGLSITAVFVIIYYRLAGFVALIGLAVNALILFGAMAMFGFTFTLPGIAGMILTIGMAVDANVLIYERLREEMAAGKSLKTAISTSYDKAFTAIFDSNLTSLITSVILFWRGSGTIKGFAVTLTIGIVASMFSAILVTRVLFRWSNDLKILKKLSFLDLIKATKFDFLGKRRAAYLVSAALMLASVGAFVVRGDKSYGIDFTGGTVVQFQFGKEKIVSQKDVEDSLAGVGLSKMPSVQDETSITGSQMTIRCATEDAEKIVTHLRESFPALAAQQPEVVNGKPTGKSTFVIQMSTEAVSATLGREFLFESGIALALGLLGILIYITIRFEFSFALGGFVAILHDVLLSAGIIVLCGGELSLIHVGALLTIAGYSINDTIVIFDRIRDSLKQGEGDIEALMNEAVNATLSRTILTSLTTIVTVAILSIFGGAALKAFSLMILIGLVVGTYSSIFIASPVVLWWSQRKGGSLRKEVLQSTLPEANAKAG